MPDCAPQLQEQFRYAYDAAWNLTWRTNNQLKQQFNVNNRNQLTSAPRSGTLTVSGAASMRKAQYPGDYGLTGVSVSGTGLSAGAAEVYADGSWAKGGAALVNGLNTYTVTATDNYGRTAQDSVAVYLPAPNIFTYDANGNLTRDGMKCFDYDFENQLTNVYVSFSWLSEFQYDAFGRRRIRREYAWLGGAWVATNEVRYVYDGRLVIQERHFDPQLSTTTPQQNISYTRGNDLSGSLQGEGGIGGLLALESKRGTRVPLFFYFFVDRRGPFVYKIQQSGLYIWTTRVRARF